MRMKIQWTDQEIRWFHNAAEYTTYNQKLAEIVCQYAKTGGTLCDIGCGAGLIDLILAPFFSHITCVDIGEKAIASVKADAQKKHISNITALCQNGETLEGQWDTVMTVFHGGSDIFEKYFKYVKDTLLIITHDNASMRFGHKDTYKKGYSAQGTKEALDQKGVVYREIKLELEHGQPFVSIEDARDFLTHYVKFDTEEELQQYLKKYVIETGEERFPYYQPKTKKIRIFVIRKGENGGLEC